MSHGVYFLTNQDRLSYIGYSNDVKKRFRCHSLKLKASAKYTKKFDQHVLVCYIQGFPSSNVALSYEWYAKRKRLKCHQTALQIINPVHKRLYKFLAPLMVDKFKQYKSHLTIYVNDPQQTWSKHISEFYQIAVLPMKKPFHSSHFLPQNPNYHK